MIGRGILSVGKLIGRSIGISKSKSKFLTASPKMLEHLVGDKWSAAQMSLDEVLESLPRGTGLFGDSVETRLLRHRVRSLQKQGFKSTAIIPQGLEKHYQKQFSKIYGKRVGAELGRRKYKTTIFHESVHDIREETGRIFKIGGKSEFAGDIEKWGEFSQSLQRKGYSDLDKETLIEEAVAFAGEKRYAASLFNRKSAKLSKHQMAVDQAWGDYVNREFRSMSLLENASLKAELQKTLEKTTTYSVGPRQSHRIGVPRGARRGNSGANG